MGKFWYRFINFLSQSIVLVFCRFRVFGQRNIPDSGGFIIASNHQCYMDPMFLSAGMRQPINFMARQELFTMNWFFGWFISSINAFPLARRTFDSSGMREALTRLAQGKAILVFPEGTRTFDGKLMPLRPGLYMLAAKAKVPVVPTLIHGGYEVWPRQRKIPVPFKSVSVHYGVPLNIADFPTQDEFMKRLYNELLALQQSLLK